MSLPIRHRTALGNLAASLCLIGCSQTPDGLAANTVARMSVMAVGAMTAVVNADDRCGFASAEVLARPRIEGTPGAMGTVTHFVDDCEIDLGPAATVLSEDCEGGTLWASGRVTISATRRISGYLTGDDATPVIPGSADAATVRITSARVAGFRAGTSMVDASLELLEGALSAVVKPRLARSASTGLCAVPTPIISLSDVAYDHAKVRLHASGFKVDLTVEASDITAQTGRFGRRANMFSGSMTLLGQRVALPAEGDDGRLDPGYSEQKFLGSYACTPDLALPVSHECVRPVDMLASATARLSVATFGSVLALAQADTTCGFSSPAVQGDPVVTGELGRDGAQATYTIATPCTITVAAPTALPALDCAHPETPSVQGSVTVTGTMTLRGIATGDVAQPIVPTSRDPVTLALEVVYHAFTVTPPGAPASFRVVTGRQTGTVLPRLGLDTSLGLCANPTPVVEMRDLALQDATVELVTPMLTAQAAIASSSLRVINGEKDGEENLIAGTITAQGEEIAIPTGPHDVGLVPGYERTAFNAYQSCTPDFALPASDADCSGKRMLAENAARLLVMAMGGVARVAQETEACGLPQMDSLPPPPEDVNTGIGSLELGWQTTACPLHVLGAPVLQECTGRNVFAHGRATVNASVGVEIMMPPVPPIGPMARDGVELKLSDVVPEAWMIRVVAPGMEEMRAAFDGGVMGAIIKPVMGEHAVVDNLFIIPTPVMGMRNLVATNVAVTMQYGAKTFRFTIEEASLLAFSGAYGGQENSLRGTIRVDGETFALEGLPLDPAYDQAAFDASYVPCTPDLREAVPATE